VGQLYADRVNNIYKDFTTDKELWAMKKQGHYREKNCSLIGK